MKFSSKEDRIIDEVMRRIKQFKEGKDESIVLYLGWPSDVKSLIEKNILTPYGGRETKRVLNW